MHDHTNTEKIYFRHTSLPQIFPNDFMLIARDSVNRK